MYLSNQEVQELAESGILGRQYTPPESPEVQDDRDSYNREYGHLFYKDGVPYKFYDAEHPDKKQNGFGGLTSQYGNRNGALNGFTVSPLELTMRAQIAVEWGDEPNRYWNDLAKKRLGKGNVSQAWGDYDPMNPSLNRPESHTPTADFGIHRLLLNGEDEV